MQKEKARCRVLFLAKGCYFDKIKVIVKFRNIEDASKPIMFELKMVIGILTSCEDPT